MLFPEFCKRSLKENEKSEGFEHMVNSGRLLGSLSLILTLSLSTSNATAEDIADDPKKEDAAVAAEKAPKKEEPKKLKPAFGGNFTFNRVKPPSAGAKKRITVQIDPEAQKRDLLGAVPETIVKTPKPPLKSASKDVAWFWNEVSPSITASGPGRFTAAMDHLDVAPEASALLSPRLETLQKIAKAHGRQILIETLGKDVSPAFVLALIAVESGGREAVKSSAGAVGLMQLIPATASRFGVKDSTDPAQNIKGGVAYLHWLLKEFKGDPILALAGYNAGENAVKKHQGVPPYAETRAYVPKVLAAWKLARALCLTPPDLYSDACVFRTMS